MRVLILIHNRAGLSGSYARAIGLARGLARLGHDISLVTASRAVQLGSRPAAYGGVHVVESAGLSPSRWRHGGFDLLDGLTRLRLLSRHRFDVVHGFEHRPSVLAPSMYAARRYHLPIISDWADLWGRGGIKDSRTWLGRATVGWYDSAAEVRSHVRASGLTVVSSALGARAMAEGYPAERVLQIPPGVDPRLIRPIEKAEARQQFGLPRGAKLVACMGVSDYDDDLAGRTFASLADLVPGVELVTIGPSKPKMLDAARQAGLQDRVHDLGIVPSEGLAAALSCADVLMLPFSDRPINRPRFPSRFGEFLASGRPMVSNLTGDLGRVMTKEGVGLAVDDQPGSMAAAIASLLNDAGLAEQMATRARRLAEGDFSWDHLAKEVEAFYRRAIDLRASG